MRAVWLALVFATMLCGCATTVWRTTYDDPRALRSLGPSALRVTMRDGPSRIIIRPDVRRDSVVGTDPADQSRIAVATADVERYETRRHRDAKPGAVALMVLGIGSMLVVIAGLFKVLSGFDGV